jgi:WD40 repeat protein
MGPDGKLYSASYDGTIRVWSDGGATIFKTEIVSEIYSLAWVDGNLVAALEEKIWVWSSDQLGPTDPPSFVLDEGMRGSYPLAVGLNGQLVTGSADGTIDLL